MTKKLSWLEKRPIKWMGFLLLLEEGRRVAERNGRIVLLPSGEERRVAEKDGRILLLPSEEVQRVAE